MSLFLSSHPDFSFPTLFLFLSPFVSLCLCPLSTLIPLSFFSFFLFYLCSMTFLCFCLCLYIAHPFSLPECPHYFLFFWVISLPHSLSLPLTRSLSFLFSLSTSLSLSLSLFIYLSIYLSICLSIYLSIYPNSIASFLSLSNLFWFLFFNF